jgi:hypothetical protein
MVPPEALSTTRPSYPPEILEIIRQFRLGLVDGEVPLPTYSSRKQQPQNE